MIYNFLSGPASVGFPDISALYLHRFDISKGNDKS